jgi:hypothetical protein
MRPADALPKLKYGFVLVGVFFASQIVWGVQRALHSDSREAGGYAAAFSMLFALILTAYFLHCIAAYHLIVSKVEGWTQPITPRRAVRFHFIPIFNLYWNYKWPRELARFVNWRTQRDRMSGWLAGTVILLGFLIGAVFDPSVGATIVLCGFAYISRCLRDAFSAPPLPRELRANSGLHASSLTTEA